MILHKIQSLRLFLLAFLLHLMMGCSSAGDPFIMNVDSTVLIGDPSSPSATRLLVNPEEQEVAGTMEGQVLQEFIDHFDLSILSFNATAEFAGVGTVNIVLDPQLPSTATIYKLNSNNQVAGTHQMNLNLIIETPDENLTISNVLLESTSALLSLAEDLPTLGFLVDGQPKEIDISQLSVLVPSELIFSDFDPQ